MEFFETPSLRDRAIAALICLIAAVAMLSLAVGLANLINTAL